MGTGVLESQISKVLEHGALKVEPGVLASGSLRGSQRVESVTLGAAEQSHGKL